MPLTLPLQQNESSAWPYEYTRMSIQQYEWWHKFLCLNRQLISTSVCNKQPLIWSKPGHSFPAILLASLPQDNKMSLWYKGLRPLETFSKRPYAAATRQQPYLNAHLKRLAKANLLQWTNEWAR